MKLILAGSARKIDSANAGWLTGAPKYRASGTRYAFHHGYGFGLVDAGAAVTLARNWTKVPSLIKSDPVSVSTSLTIPDATSTDDGDTVTSSVEISSGIDFIEFVHVSLRGEAPAFRDLQVELVSPGGAVSELSVPYESPSGERFRLPGTTRFGTARHLGEKAAGKWTLRLTDRVHGGDASELEIWSIRFFGHKSPSAPTGGPGGGASLPGTPTIQSVSAGSGALTVSWAPSARRLRAARRRLPSRRPRNARTACAARGPARR